MFVEGIDLVYWNNSGPRCNSWVSIMHHNMVQYNSEIWAECVVYPYETAIDVGRAGVYAPKIMMRQTCNTSKRPRS